ncbi:MAG: archease [Candidatus Omnitrophota bacterium]
MINYELIEHTADIGVRVWGKDLRDLFKNAAEAMLDILIERKGEAGEKLLKQEIKIEADTKEELLRSWLAELLSLQDAKKIFFTKIEIQDISEKILQAKVYTGPLGKKTHAIKTEIKAVTYHGLKIEKDCGRLKAEIIFDV